MKNTAKNFLIALVFSACGVTTAFSADIDLARFDRFASVFGRADVTYTITSVTMITPPVLREYGPNSKYYLSQGKFEVVDKSSPTASNVTTSKITITFGHCDLQKNPSRNDFSVGGMPLTIQQTITDGASNTTRTLQIPSITANFSTRYNPATGSFYFEIPAMGNRAAVYYAVELVGSRLNTPTPPAPSPSPSPSPSPKIK